MEFDGVKVKRGGERIWKARTLNDSKKNRTGSMLALVASREFSYVGVYLYGSNDLFLVSVKQGVVYKNGKREKTLPVKVSGLVEKLKTTLITP